MTKASSHRTSSGLCTYVFSIRPETEAIKDTVSRALETYLVESDGKLLPHPFVVCDVDLDERGPGARLFWSASGSGSSCRSGGACVVRHW
mmetsp:Transcript_28563/g.82377  ORF Transcript_28563/g.82377 Transcript_28563/m.82377 type:complete len:90 (-) Transcript_28563:3164-3433(-)